MGCSASASASRLTSFITHNQNPTPNSSSSFSNSQLQSPYHSFSDPSSTPISRTLSLPTPLVHHPPLRKGDSNHFVSLTSSTYGLLIDSPKPQDFANPTAAKMRASQDCVNSESPLSPDSVINTWELMQGLELDCDDEEMFDNFNPPKKCGEVEIDEVVESNEFLEVSKPLWKHLSEESLLAKMDHNVVSSYQRALLGRRQQQEGRGERLKDLLLQPGCNESPESKSLNSLVSNDSDNSCCLFGAEDRIVVYYTSLRGIRKTYEDCCAARAIIRGFRVCVDERDISMDRSYRIELQDKLKGESVRLPQVFVRGRCIGGAEEIKQLNETGELAKLLEGFPVVDLGCVCEICGDARFVPCPNCSGSRKVYEVGEGKLRRCPNCNENGLIRCSGCCS